MGENIEVEFGGAFVSDIRGLRLRENSTLEQAHRVYSQVKISGRSFKS